MRRLVTRIKRFSALLWARFTSQLLGGYVRGILTQSEDGLVFLTDPQDLGVGGSLRYFGKYGREDLEFVLSASPKDSTGPTRVLVVGAHVGVLAIALGFRTYNVDAVEANPDTFELLKANIILNGLSTNVKAHNLLATDSQQMHKFVKSRLNSGGSKILPKYKDSKYFYDSPLVVNLRGFRLDDYFGKEKFNIIVMDIEGAENIAIDGMSRILKDAKFLYIEFVPHHIARVANISFDEWWEKIPLSFDYVSFGKSGDFLRRSQAFHSLREMFFQAVTIDLILFVKSDHQES